MKNILKNKRILLIIFIVFCVLSKEVSAVKIGKPEHFNFLHRLDENFVESIEVFNNFLREDEAYLKDIDLKTLEKEIALFDKLMYESKIGFKKTKQGAFLYGPNEVGHIMVYDLASRNRRNLLKARREGGIFKYEKDVFYFPGKAVKVNFIKSMDGKKLKFVYDEVQKVLDNIEFPEDVLENTIISISPFKIRGMNGFTETYGLEKEGMTMVLGIDVDRMDIRSREFREEVRSTLIHELGHIFHEQNMRNSEDIYDLEEDFWKDYNSYYYENLNFDYMDIRSRENWRNDIRENLAEDFRIYYSEKIGEYSFIGREKNTNGSYNPDVGKFFEKYSKSGVRSEKLNLRHSTIVDGDMTYTLYDYSIREMENRNGLDINIQNKKSRLSKDSYIKFWRRGNEKQSERINLGKDENVNIHLDKNSDINIIIKYTRIGNEYIALWRLNIK